MAKSKKNKNKAKLNLTVRDEQRNKLEQMASLENRSVSNLIEVMADERWKRLAEQQGVAYAKTVAEAMNLKLRHGQSSRPREIAPGSSRSCRREKNAKAKRGWLKFFSFSFLTSILQCDFDLLRVASGLAIIVRSVSHRAEATVLIRYRHLTAICRGVFWLSCPKANPYPRRP